MKLRRVAPALLVTLAVPAGVLAATAADGPDQAAEFTAQTAENGPVGDLEAVLELQSAGPDPGVRSCFRRRGFARTAWARVPAAKSNQRVTVEATPQYASTRMPDLALFVQPPAAAGPVVSSPGLCDGRDLHRGLGQRGDPSSAVSGVLPAGAAALIQIGWRKRDAPEPVVASLTRAAVESLPAPPGDDLADAPRMRLARRTSIETRGATLGSRDPVAANCQAPATVWRKLRLRRRGVYEVAATKPAATIAAFGKRGGRFGPLGCADLADARRLAAVFTARSSATRLRLGIDDSSLSRPVRARVLGPFSRRAKGCIRARRARIAISRDAAEDVAARRTRYVLGTVRQPCGKQGRDADSVAVTIARCVGDSDRCSSLSRRRAKGVNRWNLRSASLRPGLYEISAQALAGKDRRRGRGSVLDVATIRVRVAGSAEP